MSALEELVAEQPRHPGIAAALAAGIEGALAYLVQELAPGEALDASLRQHGPPALDVTLVTLGHLAEALDRAAGEGIHHGALHPRDIVVQPGGEARLIDLGVAQALQRAGLRAPVRRPYSAPERAAGGSWGGPADIYSLGAIAYELVTGRRVTEPGTPANAAPPGVFGFDESAFTEALGRALAADPAARFGSACDLVDVLRPVLARAQRPVPVKRRSRPAAGPIVPTLPLELGGSAPAPEGTPDAPLHLPLTQPFATLDPASAEPPAAAATMRHTPPPAGVLTGADWHEPPARAERGAFVPLVIALLLGLAGGFGLGYWTAWRTAVREAPHVAAGTEVPPPSAASAAETPEQVDEPPVKSESGAPAPVAARPAPRAAPAAPPGRLLVRSTPSGARVRVDGRVRGRTPLVLRDLPLRVVMLRIDRDGYKPDERRVALTAAKPTVTVEATLAPEPPPVVAGATTGTLVVESRPVGAHVFLDGQDIGVTPLSVPGVAPGSHRIRLQLAGFNPWVTMTEVTLGTRTRVSASLEQGQQ